MSISENRAKNFKANRAALNGRKWPKAGMWLQCAKSMVHVRAAFYDMGAKLRTLKNGDEVPKQITMLTYDTFHDDGSVHLHNITSMDNFMRSRPFKIIKERLPKTR